MAFGGWMSGAIFDLTGSYLAAFANGAAWTCSTPPSPSGSWCGRAAPAADASRRR